MKVTPKQNGFSLAEVLLAVCTLAIGMSFIGGTFLVAIHLSTVATERTIAAIVADETLDALVDGTPPVRSGGLAVVPLGMVQFAIVIPGVQAGASEAVRLAAAVLPVSSSVLM